MCAGVSKCHPVICVHMTSADTIVFSAAVFSLSSQSRACSTPSCGCFLLIGSWCKVFNTVASQQDGSGFESAGGLCVSTFIYRSNMDFIHL